jgi:hypothetical protein
MRHGDDKHPRGPSLRRRIRSDFARDDKLRAGFNSLVKFALVKFAQPRAAAFHECVNTRFVPLRRASLGRAHSGQSRRESIRSQTFKER